MTWTTGFWHGLKDDFVAALNQAYRDGGWWRNLVEATHKDGDLFIAIRDNYLNAYWRGASLMKVGYRAGELKGEVHYKYLLHPSFGSPYLNVGPDGRVDLPESQALLMSDISDIAALKAAATPYTGGEKQGVHDIIKCNAGVIDTEITLGGRDQDDNVTAPRLDFAVLQDRDDVARLVFFEAKQFSNKEIRANGAQTPKVAEQIDTYATLLTQHREVLEESYRRVFENFLALKGLAGSHTVRDELMRAVLDGRKRLEIDTQPRLVIFGFDQDQKLGRVWKPHRDKLEELLGAQNVLLKGKSGDFRRGISVL